MTNHAHKLPPPPKLTVVPKPPGPDYVGQLFSCLEGLMDVAHSYDPADLEDDAVAEQVTVLTQTVELVAALFNEHTRALGAIEQTLAAQSKTGLVVP